MYVNAIRALITCLVIIFIGLFGAFILGSFLTVDSINHNEGGKKRSVSVYDYER